MDGEAAGNTIEVDSLGKGDGVPDPSTRAGEFMEYNGVPNTLVDDGYEGTDATYDADGLNITVGNLPNNSAVTADNMQPILRMVSVNTRILLTL